MTHASLDARPRLLARSEPIADPGDLLDHLAADGFAWLDGEHGFVTSGVAAVVEPDDAAARLAAIDHERLAGTPGDAGPRAVGALTFRGDGRLAVPALVVGRDAEGRAWRTRIAGAQPDPAPARTTPGRFTIEPRTDRATWRRAVTTALDEIVAGRIEKVVLARDVHVRGDEPFDVRDVLAVLRATQPGCTVYADGGFVGASPELLVRRTGREVTSRPLAGTGLDATRLLASAKDAHEHAIVVRAVTEALARLADDVRTEGPVAIELPTVTHLATTVRARLHEPSTTALDLARALHPTPAVGGTPRGPALALMAELEAFDRGRYAGPCGWVDATGDGAFVVALRCAQLDGVDATCFAGAGIVAGSDPDAEWRETQAKLDPILRALVRP